MCRNMYFCYYIIIIIDYNVNMILAKHHFCDNVTYKFDDIA